MASFEAAACAALPEATPKELAGLMWAYGKMRRHPGAQLAAAVDSATVRCLAAGRLELPDDAQSEQGVPGGRPGSARQGKGGEFLPEALASLLWAHARLNVAPAEATMDLLLDAARAAVPHAGPQDLCNIVWALATLKWHPGKSWLA